MIFCPICHQTHESLESTTTEDTVRVCHLESYLKNTRKNAELYKCSAEELWLYETMEWSKWLQEYTKIRLMAAGRVPWSFETSSQNEEEIPGCFEEEDDSEVPLAHGVEVPLAFRPFEASELPTVRG